ncbi:MAG: membrane protein insertase YidC [Acidimicrobiaceae bacterium]|nr:membrane protein insertase YidC [Acidimicrobiaceae bacterium]
MLDPLFDLITAVLAWFYSLWPSYGMAIAFLTLTTTIAVTPLTLKFTRSTLQMQQHMPELKKIQAQYRGDRQAMNEATAAFYKEHGLNPVGCLLPMLVQAPIFLVMYRVVDGLTRRTTEIGTQIGYTSRRYADTAFETVPQYAETPIPRGDLAFDPDFLSRDTALYGDLSGNLEMVSWGVDLSRSASDALSAGIVEALPYFLMILFVLVTSLVQQRQIQGRQTQAMPPQQQMMMKLIPYMLPVFSYVMPGAVVVYFIVSNMVRIAQQAYITRSFYRGEDSLGAQVAKQRAAATDEAQAEPDPKQRSAKSITEKKGTPTPKRDAATAKGKAPSRKRGAGAEGKRAPARKRDGAPARGKAGAGKQSAAPARGKAPASKRGAAPARGKAGAGKQSAAPARGKIPRRRRGDDTDSQARERPSTARRSGGGKTGKAPTRSRSSSRATGGRTTAPGSAPKRGNANRSRSKKKRR